MPLRRSTVHTLELVDRVAEGTTVSLALHVTRARTACDRPGARRPLHVAAADGDRAVRDR
jgi:hypothetical protein